MVPGVYGGMDDLTQADGIEFFQAKRYAEAAEAFRQLLAQSPSAGLEADTRRRLADTLASLGQTEDAAAERELAANIAENSTGDPMALMTKGDLLKRDHRYNEACAAYEQALRLLSSLPSEPLLPPAPPPSGVSRSYLMAKLALAHYEAGRPAKTVIWAGASLANSPNTTICLMMHRMCGVGYSDLGDFVKAEAHYLHALKLAAAGGKPSEIAQSLTTLASVQRKRGRLNEAITTARRATAVFAHPGRGGLLAEAECLRDLGRFEEARAVVATMKQGPYYDRPDIEQRTQVICSLTLAWIEANDNRPDAALAALQEAWENLGVVRGTFPLLPLPEGGADKLVLYCDSTAIRVYALLGQVENAHQMQESVETRLEGLTEDRASRLGVYSEIAPAALALGDYTQCQNWWQKYLECRPDIVGQVKAHYSLGEVLAKRGETQAAVEAYTQALALGVDSFHAQRAKARLEELGG